jgi:transposase
MTRCGSSWSQLRSGDHLVRKIDAALDLSWLRSELAPHYSSTGRPSIDPELDDPDARHRVCLCDPSERLVRREVQVNLSYRWFCKLGIEDAIPDHSAFSRACTPDISVAVRVRRVKWKRQWLILKDGKRRSLQISRCPRPVSG